MNGLQRTAAVAAIEFRISLRNRWVLLATAVLTLFSLALAFSGGNGAGLKAGVLSLSAASLATLSVYLIPLISLLVSYDSVAGEVERGTMALVLATPLKRGELLAGKFAGLVAVLAIAICIGFTIAASATIAAYGMDGSGIMAMLRLTASGVMLGAVFIAIGMAVSIASARAGTAAALAVAIWLFAVVLYDLALLAGIVADKGGMFTKVLFPYLIVANPGDAFRIFNLAGLDSASSIGGLDGIANTLPFSPLLGVGALVAWLVAALALGFLKIRRLAP